MYSPRPLRPATMPERVYVGASPVAVSAKVLSIEEPTSVFGISSVKQKLNVRVMLLPVVSSVTVTAAVVSIGSSDLAVRVPPELTETVASPWVSLNDAPLKPAKYGQRSISACSPVLMMKLGCAIQFM